MAGRPKSAVKKRKPVQRDVEDDRQKRKMKENEDGEIITHEYEEAELARLNADYIRMKNDFAVYKTVSGGILSKQKFMIDMLEKESEELDWLLVGAGKLQIRYAHHSVPEERQILGMTEREYEEEVQLEKAEIRKLDKEILQTQDAIVEYSKKIAVDKDPLGMSIAYNKKKVALENTLERMLAQFKMELVKNRKIREDIDILNGDNRMAAKEHRDLEKECSRNKEKIHHLVGAGLQVFEHRDDVRHKVNVLTEQRDRDQHLRGAELKDLERELNHDTKMQNFLTTKTYSRAKEIAEERERKPPSTREEEEYMLIQWYEDAFRRMKEITGEDDVDVILDNFSKNEDETIALLNYANELEREVECLNFRTDDMKSEIEEATECCREAESQRNATINSLQACLDNARSRSEAAEMRINEINQELDEILPDVQLMFEQTDCAPPVLCPYDPPAPVSAGSLRVYLALIEKYVSHLVSVLHYNRLLRGQQHRRVRAIPEILELSEVPGGKHHVAPPDASKLSVSEACGDEEDYPLSQMELRDRVVREIERREQEQLERLMRKTSRGQQRHNSNMDYMDYWTE